MLPLRLRLQEKCEAEPDSATAFVAVADCRAQAGALPTVDAKSARCDLPHKHVETLDRTVAFTAAAGSFSQELRPLVTLASYMLPARNSHWKWSTGNLLLTDLHLNLPSKRH
jgi:hypothetical protein